MITDDNNMIHAIDINVDFAAKFEVINAKSLSVVQDHGLTEYTKYTNT